MFSLLTHVKFSPVSNYQFVFKLKLKACPVSVSRELEEVGRDQRSIRDVKCKSEDGRFGEDNQI